MSTNSNNHMNNSSVTNSFNNYVPVIVEGINLIRSVDGVGVVQEVSGGNVIGNVEDAALVQGINDSAVVKGNNSAAVNATNSENCIIGYRNDDCTINVNSRITAKEAELCRIFRLLDIRGQNKLLGAAFSLEEGESI